MTRLKPTQPSLPFAGQTAPKPREIVTESSEEFFRVVAQAEAGALVVEAVAQGDGNGQWKFQVRWLK